MPRLSVTVIAKNEAANLPAALESVSWADEIVVVDAESTDSTVTLAHRYTDRVLVRRWTGYVDQKNYAADAARHDWILSLDADERVPAALANEIRALLSREPRARGYRVPRVTQYLGTWVRSTDWYPDYQLRLYDRRAGRWHGGAVHESVVVDGSVATLRSDLEHHSFRDVSHQLQKMDRYAGLWAAGQFDAGRRAGSFDLLLHPLLAFFRNYVLRRGVGQGRVGLTTSTLNACYVFLKFAKLFELERLASAPTILEEPRKGQKRA